MLIPLLPVSPAGDLVISEASKGEAAAECPSEVARRLGVAGPLFLAMPPGGAPRTEAVQTLLQQTPCIVG
eukprot:2812490-Prymnesium_polylepis.1